MKLVKVVNKVKKSDADMTILAAKRFGDILVRLWGKNGSLIIWPNGTAWVDFFCTSVAGNADTIREAYARLAEAKMRQKNYENAIKWAGEQIKKFM